jgi:hypothetical protein
MASLEHKQAHLSSLHSQLDSRIAHSQKVVDFLLRQNNQPQREDAAHNIPSVEQIYNDIDHTSLKLTALISRTTRLMQRVGEYNRQALEDAQINERLDQVLSEEMKRRDKFAEWKSTNLIQDLGNNDTVVNEYMSLEDLHAMFDHEKLITPTEEELTQSILEYTRRQLDEMERSESAAANAALEDANKAYAAQFASISSVNNEISSGACISIPQSVSMVNNELISHHLGVNMVDYAAYETGGSVVYSLTSLAYRPIPRNTVPSKEDVAVEQMWFERQAYYEKEHNKSIKKKMEELLQRHSFKEWYSNYPLGNIRQYLPQDWERTIDWMYHRFSSRKKWDDYTPRGAMDAIVPDYVYQSLGFGELAQTAGPEVVISSKGGMSKQLGYCYPLSMHPDDDPALSYISRIDSFDGDESVSSLLTGAKFTIRLSQPIYIDAVTLEQKSFPISKMALEAGLKGGESAPRHVRVVGFPSCSDTEDEDCVTRGFDVTNPIDLGSLEYQRVTVSGQEDDDEGAKMRRKRSVQTFAVKGGTWKPQTGSDEALETPETSVAETSQCSFDDLECNAKQLQPQQPDNAELDPLAKALAAQGGGGECKPNYEDMQAAPSCGGDDDISNAPSASSNRNAVAAVSFIIEENWGNSEYTCLYRVQVHGDAVSS